MYSQAYIPSRRSSAERKHLRSTTSIALVVLDVVSSFLAGRNDLPNDIGGYLERISCSVDIAGLWERRRECLRIVE